MTKEEFIGYIQAQLGNDGSVPEPIIDKVSCQAWDRMLMHAYGRRPSFIDRYAITSKPVAVLRDETFGYYYSVLPAKPIRFTDISEGVRRIYKKRQLSTDSISTGDEITFVPMPVTQTQLISNTDAGMITNVIGYFVVDDKLRYFNMKPDITEVYMDIVSPLENLPYDHELNIPAGGEDVLLGFAREILAGTPFVDPKLRKINIQNI